MIKFPEKRLFGLIGIPRVGKNAVAQYLKETRDFVVLAFADRIKEEYGISLEDFETAKITGEIDKIRKELWEFSEERKKLDPFYFIKKVAEEAFSYNKSIVITDIRTPEELDTLLYYGDGIINVRRAYHITAANEPLVEDFDENGFLLDSKLPLELIVELISEGQVKTIHNKKKGIFYFNKYLDDFFFKEDIMDIPDNTGNVDDKRSMVSNYLSQFYIVQRQI